jgi:chemotaxis protein MotB
MARFGGCLVIGGLVWTLTAPVQALDKMGGAEMLQQHLQTSRDQMRMLSDRTKALANQFDVVKTALLDSRRRNVEQAARISALGNQLEALHRQRRVRTVFFSELAGRLGEIPGIEVSGDKIVLSGDWLFESGVARISTNAESSLSRLIEALLQVKDEVPDDMAWALRIEGHTDSLQPGPDSTFDSDWAMSSARALSVLGAFQAQGLPSRHLSAAALADTRPLVFGVGDAAKRLNRRVEIHLSLR